MDILFKQIKITFLVGIFTASIYSCQTENKTLQYSDEAVFNTEDTVGNQNLVLYSLPNPLSVSYIIHTAKIDFKEEYLTYSENEILVGEADKNKLAVQLGILLVEYGYVSFYEKHNFSLVYLKKIEELLRTLDLQNQKTIHAISLLKDNITNRDSINQVILETYEDVGADLLEQKNDNVALNIANGVFLHSLYILSDAYTELQNNKDFIESNGTINDYRALLVQFKFYLENFIELLNNSSEEYKALYDLLTDLKTEFNKMSINFSISEKTGEVENVTFRRHNLYIIGEKILKFRELHSL